MCFFSRKKLTDNEKVVKDNDILRTNTAKATVLKRDYKALRDLAPAILFSTTFLHAHSAPSSLSPLTYSTNVPALGSLYLYESDVPLLALSIVVIALTIA